MFFSSSLLCRVFKLFVLEITWGRINNQWDVHVFFKTLQQIQLSQRLLDVKVYIQDCFECTIYKNVCFGIEVANLDKKPTKMHSS